MTPQTPFIIGSVSKSFTALAVMQLVEEGKVGLDGVRDAIGELHLVDRAVRAALT